MPNAPKISRFLKQLNLKTARAWSLKEQLRGMWTYTSEAWASKYFDKWYQWASRSKLKPMVKVAKTVKDHLPEVLNYFKHFITNSTSEGFNSVIQSIKSSAKGFKKFQKLQDQNPLLLRQAGSKTRSNFPLNS